MSEYLIVFCWNLKMPAGLKVNGETYYITNPKLVVEATSKKDAFSRLKGSSHKVLTSVTSIECLQ